MYSYKESSGIIEIDFHRGGGGGSGEKDQIWRQVDYEMDNADPVVSKRRGAQGEDL
jgi:hypothetical protein